jgi:hypothetical protein
VHLQSKNGLPRHRVVQLMLKIGESGIFDNTFFNKSHWCNVLQKNQLLFLAGFYPMPVHGLNEVGAFMGKGFRGDVFGIKAAYQ